MNSIDTSIAHTTSKSGNVSEDLGLNSQKAAKLIIKSHVFSLPDQTLRRLTLALPVPNYD